MWQKHRGRPRTTLPTVLNRDLALIDHEIRLHSSDELDKIAALAPDRRQWHEMTVHFTILLATTAKTLFDYSVRTSAYATFLIRRTMRIHVGFQPLCLLAADPSFFSERASKRTCVEAEGRAAPSPVWS
ncbi:hypothetical protein ElyMa_001347900 [Elysia marginata]|uniref:Uncharacterized protein n=1 Tax=Elysia marginata TaxID=1093978 RepID=A0AAV4IP19_9GAST|nr:hypothetical protein ElyMa_001347900 [Elysia marginata]